jgi:membrane fusion protein (multidrug efflux system)
LNELDINLQEAKRQLKRIDNLAQKSVASAQLLDEQQARVKALQAQQEVAKAQLDELELRAPFAGVLGTRQVSLGALVMPGDLIATLDDLHLVKVDFNIAESHLPSVAKGQLVRATSVAYPGEVFEGKISNINSRVDPVTRAIQIRAIITNDGLKLRPGMLLQINLQKQILDTLVVPEGALVPIEDKQFVFVINDNKASRKEVNVGRRKPGIAQILSGIEAGDNVVIEGSLRLRDGSAVKVLDAPEVKG